MYQTINGLSTIKCIDILLKNKFTIINSSSSVTITDNVNKFSQSIDKENIIKCLKIEKNIIFMKYSKITEKSYTKEQLKDIDIPTIILDTDRGYPAEYFYLDNGFEPSDSSIILYGDTSNDV